ncbi:MAG: phosphoribosyltransferase family protein, partial [Pseudolabrys sp.]
LASYKDQQPVVLALPRGGVPVAAQVAKVLHAPLDLILVRKIGVPMQPELAMGAVVDGATPLIVRNEDVITLASVSETEFKKVCDQELAEIERRRGRYLGGRARAEVEGKTAIVIDDGVATGATTRAALRATRLRKPKKLVLAVPVAPTETLPAMREEADDVVCLEDHELFGAIGYYYSDFRQISDQEVIDTLARFAQAPK